MSTYHGRRRAQGDQGHEEATGGQDTVLNGHQETHVLCRVQPQGQSFPVVMSFLQKQG